jgi:hypothetical protein
LCKRYFSKIFRIFDAHPWSVTPTLRAARSSSSASQVLMVQLCSCRRDMQRAARVRVEPARLNTFVHVPRLRNEGNEDDAPARARLAPRMRCAITQCVSRLSARYLTAHRYGPTSRNTSRSFQPHVHTHPTHAPKGPRKPPLNHRRPPRAARLNLR